MLTSIFLSTIAITKGRRLVSKVILSLTFTQRLEYTKTKSTTVKWSIKRTKGMKNKTKKKNVVKKIRHSKKRIILLTSNGSEPQTSSMRTFSLVWDSSHSFGWFWEWRHERNSTFHNSGTVILSVAFDDKKKTSKDRNYLNTSKVMILFDFLSGRLAWGHRLSYKENTVRGSD